MNEQTNEYAGEAGEEIHPRKLCTTCASNAMSTCSSQDFTRLNCTLTVQFFDQYWYVDDHGGKEPGT